MIILFLKSGVAAARSRRSVHWAHPASPGLLCVHSASPQPAKTAGRVSTPMPEGVQGAERLWDHAQLPACRKQRGSLADWHAGMRLSCGGDPRLQVPKAAGSTGQPPHFPPGGHQEVRSDSSVAAITVYLKRTSACCRCIRRIQATRASRSCAGVRSEEPPARGGEWRQPQCLPSVR